MANGITYGINFPFLQSSKGNYLKLTETTDEEIRTDLVHLLLTRRGSRYFLPDFGTRLYEFIFEPLDGATFEEIRAEIEEQVATYRIPGANTAEYTAKIKIDYTNDARAFGSREFVIINI